LAATNRPSAVHSPERLKQVIPKSLMIPFAMIVGDKLRGGSSKMALAQRDQPIETFLFNRADEALCMRVRVRRPIPRRADDVLTNRDKP
jgi:hypothetical protein